MPYYNVMRPLLIIAVFVCGICPLSAQKNVHFKPAKKDTLFNFRDTGFHKTDTIHGKADSLHNKADTLNKKKIQPAKVIPAAPKRLLLKIVINDSLRQGFKMPFYEKKFATAAQRNKQIQQLLFALYDQSYLAATVDSSVQDSTLLTVYFGIGNKYEWAYLHKGNVDQEPLNMSGYRTKLFSGKPLYYKNALKLMNKLLTWYENQGYPFAQVKLDSIQFHGNQLSATLKIEKKSIEKIDSIEVIGNLKLAPRYLYGYLGIKPGDMYDEAKVDAISNRLKAAPFLYETKQMQVIFVQSKVRILLYLGKKSANQFDGIVGILPNQNNGGIILTGDINLQLVNSFHEAEEIGFHWQHIQPLTENLMLHFGYPYLFHTPLGLDLNGNLFKQDTTYLQIDTKIGLKYLMAGGNYWEAYYENISNVVISNSASQNPSVLPAFANGTTALYGLEFRSNGLDYPYNPHSGYYFLANASAGIKTISVNPNLDPSLYDGLQLKSTVYKGTLQAEYYIPFTLRSAFKFEVQGATINDPSLLINDLFRIGGFEIMRGFNEQSIYASSYSVGTVEFHYLLEQNSFLFLFFDQGWVRETLPSALQYFNDTPLGFGAGMNFQTKAGIFSISYAVGKSTNQPLNFSYGKINFGLINNF